MPISRLDSVGRNSIPYNPQWTVKHLPSCKLRLKILSILAGAGFVPDLFKIKMSDHIKWNTLDYR